MGEGGQIADVICLSDSTCGNNKNKEVQDDDVVYMGKGNYHQDQRKSVENHGKT